MDKGPFYRRQKLDNAITFTLNDSVIKFSDTCTLPCFVLNLFLKADEKSTRKMYRHKTARISHGFYLIKSKQSHVPEKDYNKKCMSFNNKDFLYIFNK